MATYLSAALQRLLKIAVADVVQGIRSIVQGDEPSSSADPFSVLFNVGSVISRFGGVVSRLGIGMPVVDGKVYWKVVPGYVDDDFEMQEHTGAPTLQDHYRIIRLKGRWKTKAAVAKTFDEIKQEWDRLHKDIQ